MMGFDPATIALGIGAGTQLFSAITGYGEQRAARKRQSNASDAAQKLTQGPNGVDQMIMAQLSRPNSGQDGFLQMLRSNPNSLKPYMFDYSQAFKDLQARDNYTINDQVAGLRAGAGSLGARFGTGFANKEAMLRGRFGADISARNAGIAQQSFQNALQFGQQGYAVGQSQNNQLLQLLLNSQQGRTQQQLGALGMQMTPLPSAAGVVGQGGADIAQLLLLGNYMRGQGQPAGGGGGFQTGGFNPAPGNFTPNTSFWGGAQTQATPAWWMR